MDKENGFAYQILALIIIIVIAIAGVCINELVGKNGVLNKVAEVENQYIKEEVLEKINYKVTQKFIELNNEAKASGKSISEIYNSDVVIEFLKQNLIIEPSCDENGNVEEGKYMINVDKVKDEEENNIEQVGNFKLEKIEDRYMVIYYENEKKSQEIGELQIQQI